VSNVHERKNCEHILKIQTIISTHPEDSNNDLFGNTTPASEALTRGV